MIRKKYSIFHQSCLISVAHVPGGQKRNFGCENDECARRRSTMRAPWQFGGASDNAAIGLTHPSIHGKGLDCDRDVVPAWDHQILCRGITFLRHPRLFVHDDAHHVSTVRARTSAQFQTIRNNSLGLHAWLEYFCGATEKCRNKQAIDTSVKALVSVARAGGMGEAIDDPPASKGVSTEP